MLLQAGAWVTLAPRPVRGFPLKRIATCWVHHSRQPLSIPEEALSQEFIP